MGVYLTNHSSEMCTQKSPWANKVEVITYKFQPILTNEVKFEELVVKNVVEVGKKVGLGRFFDVGTSCGDFGTKF